MGALLRKLLLVLLQKTLNCSQITLIREEIARKPPKALSDVTNGGYK